MQKQHSALLMATRFPIASVNAVNKYGNSALHAAAYSGKLAVADALLKSWRFEQSNSLNKMGSTALHIAAFFGHADVVQLLLASRRFTASSLANGSGLNALHLGAMQGQHQVVEVFLASFKFDRSAVNAITPDDGSTALHLAVQFRRLSVVSLLLENKRFSSVRKATANGHTALHLAAACPSDGMVAALLNSDRFTTEVVTATNSSGRTALHIMAEKGQLEAARLLRTQASSP